ncbi:MAG: cytochrome c peroxidase [Cytophagales bacterium]|nr:cytochrome c peroxidase [Cytophagales bacterium]
MKYTNMKWIRLYMLIVCVAVLCAYHMPGNSLEYKIARLIKANKIQSLTHDNVIGMIKKTPAKSEVELGKKLFFDVRFSKNNNLSCASCHEPDKGFSNGVDFASGTHGNKLSRHVPHLYNLALNRNMFWDGRATGLEDQLDMVLASKEELDMNYPELISKLSADALYPELFHQAYPEEGICKKSIKKAIIAYEKTLLSVDSKYDKYISGDGSVFDDQEKLGLELFIGKANCVACHKGANLTDDSFHNIGVITSDVGRQKIDKIGMNKEFESTPYPFFSTFKAFKTPSLRNVSATAPYFHNGSKKNLREVVEFYNKGGENQDKTGLAKEIVSLGLTDREIDALVAFLNTLSTNQKLY